MSGAAETWNEQRPIGRGSSKSKDGSQSVSRERSRCASEGTSNSSNTQQRVQQNESSVRQVTRWRKWLERLACFAHQMSFPLALSITRDLHGEDGGVDMGGISAMADFGRA